MPYEFYTVDGKKARGHSPKKSEPEKCAAYEKFLSGKKITKKEEKLLEEYIVDARCLGRVSNKDVQIVEMRRVPKCENKWNKKE